MKERTKRIVFFKEEEAVVNVGSNHLKVDKYRAPSKEKLCYVIRNIKYELASKIYNLIMSKIIVFIVTVLSMYSLGKYKSYNSVLQEVITKLLKIS